VKVATFPLAFLRLELLVVLWSDFCCRFNLSFYDSAYLKQAEKSKSTLVTDDKKLAEMAKKAGVKNLTSRELAH